MMVARVFDRIARFDERSRGYSVADLITRDAETHIWRVPKTLDQGSEGACVGYAITHELIAFPVPLILMDATDARAIYHSAQTLDQWDGEDYDGTSVLAGMKAATALGYYSEYRWAFSMADLARAVTQIGPAVLGVNWYTGLAETDSSGFIHLDGDPMGGHALLCNGYDEDLDAFRLHNSWGTYWGVGGECWIEHDDLYALLQDDGEACIPLVRSWGWRRTLEETD